jgi:hypothetical protein
VVANHQSGQHQGPMKPDKGLSTKPAAMRRSGETDDKTKEVI